MTAATNSTPEPARTTAGVQPIDTAPRPAREATSPGPPATSTFWAPTSGGLRGAPIREHDPDLTAEDYAAIARVLDDIRSRRAHSLPALRRSAPRHPDPHRGPTARQPTERQ